MGPLLVVFGDPRIKVGLQLVDRAVDLFAEHHPVEFVQDGAMEALTNSIRLRALGLGPAVINVLDGEIELKFVALGAAKLGAAVSQHARQPDAVLIVECTTRSLRISAAVIGVLRSYNLANATLA